jgi:hypothetical protein
MAMGGGRFPVASVTEFSSPRNACHGHGTPSAPASRSAPLSCSRRRSTRARCSLFSGHTSAKRWSALAEIIEAATRCGMPERAVGAYQQLTEITRASVTDWALGIEARSCALLSSGKVAEPAFHEAIDRLGRTRIRGELARAISFTANGSAARTSASMRSQLRTAHATFADIGAEAFAQRAAWELRATGVNARKRTRLFSSPPTVEWHLSSIFGKLNITSRR